MDMDRNGGMGSKNKEGAQETKSSQAEDLVDAGWPRYHYLKVIHPFCTEIDRHKRKGGGINWPPTN